MKHYIRKIPALLVIVGTWPLFAQNRASAPDSNSDTSTPDVIMLSPFEVSTDRGNSGYSAATALAGNRLSTRLSDVGSAISVVTEQFLRDTGATSNTTLLQYTTSTEVGGVFGTLANAGSGTQRSEVSNFLNPNGNTRVRGLTSADFFQSAPLF